MRAATESIWLEVISALCVPHSHLSPLVLQHHPRRRSSLLLNSASAAKLFLTMIERPPMALKQDMVREAHPARQVCIRRSGVRRSYAQEVHRERERAKRLSLPYFRRRVLASAARRRPDCATRQGKAGRLSPASLGLGGPLRKEAREPSEEHLFVQARRLELGLVSEDVGRRAAVHSGLGQWAAVSEHNSAHPSEVDVNVRRPRPHHWAIAFV